MFDRLAKGSRHEKLITALLIVGSLAPGAMSLQTIPAGASQPRSAGQPTSSTSRYLGVTINPSTTNIIEGAVYGLHAELENVSSVPITLDLGHLQLAVQPELAPTDFSCTWFYDAARNGLTSLAMLPGDHFTVFFDTGARASAEALKADPSCVANFWGRLRRRLDFVPGNYAFVVIGSFTYTPTLQGISSLPASKSASPAVEAKPEEHYFAQTANLPVTIDQAQVIIYAGLGGLLAFLVMTFRSANTLSEYAGKVQATSDKPPFKLVIIARGAGAAILLSATVTVIASRLSTTAFPVKVSVDDFWGAITVGFVSYFIGGSFIDRLSGLTSTSQPPLPPTPKPSAPTSVPTLPAPAAPGPPATAEVPSSTNN